MSYFNFQGKKVHYVVAGTGSPLMLLHGNTTSSRLFNSDIAFFSQYFKVIALDYPGHGFSDRLEVFPKDFWRYNAQCAIQLCHLLAIEQINLIGTSGGALVALNMAVLANELAPMIIADSFFGNRLSAEEAEKIVKGRKKAKRDFMMMQYWKQFNGEYWDKMVDLDCDTLLAIGREKLPLIWGDLSKIKSEVLLVGTSSDELIPDAHARMTELAEIIPTSELALYNYGRHTFMITEKEEFRRIALDFLSAY